MADTAADTGTAGLGAASSTMSRFGGAVDGKRSVVADSVALTPRVPAWSTARLVAAPFLCETVLGFRYPKASRSEDAGRSRGKLFSKAVSSVHHECDVPACHLLSTMWGTGRPALYAHETLAEVTHRRGGDLYGATSRNYFRRVTASALTEAGRTQ